MAFSTEQESFWAGTFGAEYAERNTGTEMLAGNLRHFSRVLERTTNVRSVLELGANVGMNVRALKQLLPHAALAAVEINPHACRKLREVEGLSVTEGSLFDFEAKQPFDLVFVMGVLIHLAPERLNDAYDVLARSSARYIMLGEYYNPTPVEVPYRGHSGRLFKRDFAGELLARHSSFELVDYGFVYHRDRHYTLDDVTWFLLEKRS